MRRIRKVAVLGSGAMGTGIACHLANVGLESIVLDIIPPNLPEKDRSNKDARNSLAATALKNALKSKPAALYNKEFINRITIGNFEDDFEKIAECDWIIEVVIERLDIKNQIFSKVDQYRKKGSLVSTNTSSIPVHLMLDGRTDDFQQHFCGTHFFNPPRYMKLLEIIPTPKTHNAVTDFFMEFGSRILGKETVLCKDTPAFIANRVGVYAMAKIFQLSKEFGLRIEEVDRLTGPAIGRPNTGTFRLGDMVGLDVAEKVINEMKKKCPDDEQIHDIPEMDFFTFLIKNKFFGNKTNKGFYEKTNEIDDKGKKKILALRLDSLEYEFTEKVSLPSLSLAKQIDHVSKRIKAVYNAEDIGGQFVKKSLASLFAYVSNRIPEISDHIHGIDDAMRAGYAWELGPFEYWDAVGIQEGIKAAEDIGEKIAPWVFEMIEAGYDHFYKQEAGQNMCYDPGTKSYYVLKSDKAKIVLDTFRHKKPVYQNDEVALHDIGDQVLCLEFTSKMNAIGGSILQGIQDSIEIAENGTWKGLVIGNNAKHFTVGANLMLIGMMAFQQQYEELNIGVKMFQDTSMRCRYSSIPVVAAVQGYTFGGGCELLMHCDATVASAESYVGLVEMGVGLLPGGAGTKEFALRISDSFQKEDIKMPTYIDHFTSIAQAKVSTSAHEAFGLHYFLPEKDSVVINGERNIGIAKQKVLSLADDYIQPVERRDIEVLGRAGLATAYIAINQLKRGGYASDYDAVIATKIANVLCGGDLTSPQPVSEQYLLDLEREAFLSLTGEQKTLERIQHMLEKNKPLRN